tara:strand:- start:317 stop:571 length:255 start_codon:yes stop_codon:yes gene_type:complete
MRELELYTTDPMGRTFCIFMTVSHHMDTAGLNPKVEMNYDVTGYVDYNDVHHVGEPDYTKLELDELDIIADAFNEITYGDEDNV